MFLQQAGAELRRKFYRAFAVTPVLDAGLTQQHARKLAVRDEVRGLVDHYVQRPGAKATQATTARALDMTPTVRGGFLPGDIVLRGNAEFVDTMALGGLATTVARGLKTGRWQRHEGVVGHAGLVVKGPDGKLAVLEIFREHTDAALDRGLTPAQRAKPHTWIRRISIDAYFNEAPRGPLAQAVVARHRDPAAARASAERAQRLFDTQTGPDGLKPWLHGARPRTVDGRGGPCSSFVNVANGYAFDQPLGIPVSPEAILVDGRLEVVGRKAITQVAPLLEKA